MNKLSVVFERLWRGSEFGCIFPSTAELASSRFLLTPTRLKFGLELLIGENSFSPNRAGKVFMNISCEDDGCICVEAFGSKRSPWERKILENGDPSNSDSLGDGLCELSRIDWANILRRSFPRRFKPRSHALDFHLLKNFFAKRNVRHSPILNQPLHENANHESAPLTCTGPRPLILKSHDRRSYDGSRGIFNKLL